MRSRILPAALWLAAMAASPGIACAADVATATATFAGGCFWCMVAPFKALPGVRTVTSGYTGGHVANPSYEQVSSGDTGHAESVQVVYAPSVVTYEKLLDVYWHNIDPTQQRRQFCDAGDQYRTAIFYHDEGQKKAALASRDALQATAHLPGKIATEIVPAGPFYPAEGYHQDFYLKEKIHYEVYRQACGRDERLQKLYGERAGGH